MPYPLPIHLFARCLMLFLCEAVSNALPFANPSFYSLLDAFLLPSSEQGFTLYESVVLLVA